MIDKSNTNLKNNFEYVLTFQDYLIIFRIHLKKIISIFILAFFISIYYTFNIPPKYQASATVEIREKPGANMIMDLSGNMSQKRMINEIQVIKSRLLAKKVIEVLWNSDRRNNLHLFGTRVFLPRGQRLRRTIKELFTLGLYDSNSNIPKIFNEPYSESIGNRFANSLIGKLSVENIINTNILKLTYTSPNADEARRVVNVIANKYVQYDGQRSRENAVRSLNFLDSLVTIQEKKIKIKEKSIRDFKLKNNMYSLDGDATSIVSELNTFESQLYENQVEINIKREKVDILNSKLTDEEKTFTEELMNDINSQLLNLRVEISNLEAQMLQSINTYGEKHGAVIELEKKLTALKKELNKKVSQFVSKGIRVQDPLKARQDMMTELLKLDTDIVGLELRRIEIQKLLDIFNNKLRKIPEKQMELARLDRDNEILNQGYSYLRQKLEDAKLNVIVQVGDASLLDLGRTPTRPVGPNHKKNILLGMFLGVFLGIVLAIIIEFVDNTLKTIDEIEKYNLSVLGIIPSISSRKSDSELKLFSPNSKFYSKSSNNLKRRLITREDPKSPVSEAYRSLRTNFLYSTENDIKSILVSSAGPGEGKTTTVANLAITYANLGKRTLLVDTDLRRPVVHKVFNLERDPGVTNYLSSQTENYKDLVKKTDISNLSVITSGIIPPNPSEMLGSKRMIQLVKLLEEDWDMVLFDSPPLVAVTDANMLSKEIDQIALVVKVGQTDKKAFHHTITNLKNINAPLCGIIMNAVTNKSSYGSYYYYYYHQYYNYYGTDKQ
tara:strand:+ start:2550 stop:4889 length:2340 start_codon:yes stop_codon:yes gene_type:complete